MNKRLPKLKAMPAIVIAAAMPLIAIGGLSAHMVGSLVAAPSPMQLMAGFATPLEERTESQRHNTRLAAEAINGAVVQPGAEFSFNHCVKSWSSDRGYVKAPVSFDGELIRATGGGVCQTSTTLYNAALLSGMTIVERHPHEFAPHYVAPGQDAAVAYPHIDLRFRNPFRWPVKVKASVMGGKLQVQISGAEKSRLTYEIRSVAINHEVPGRYTRLHRNADERAYVRNPGSEGGRTITYRVGMEHGTKVKSEKLSDDTYQTMNRVVQLNSEN